MAGSINLDDEILPLLRREINVSSKKAIRTLAKEANTKAAEWARDSLSDALKSSNFRDELAQMHEELGQIARQGMLKAYDDGKKRGRKPYRQEDEGTLKRYTGGVMRKGLQSPDLIKTSADGISFNFDILWRYAHQWARLNFGTAPAGSKRVDPTKIRVFRKSLQDSPSLAGIGSRPGFLVPSNFASYGVSSGKAYAKTPSPASIVQSPKMKRYLYVYSSKRGLGKRAFRNKKSKGILGWRFLDQGINEMNKQYGVKLTKVLENRMAGKKFVKSETVTANTKFNRIKGPADRSQRARAQNRDARGRFRPGFRN